jgi:hypothetical protein
MGTKTLIVVPTVIRIEHRPPDSGWVEAESVLKEDGCHFGANYLCGLDSHLGKGATIEIVKGVAGGPLPSGWRLECDPKALLWVLENSAHFIAKVVSAEWVVAFARRAVLHQEPGNPYSNISLLKTVSVLANYGPKGLGRAVFDALILEGIIRIPCAETNSSEYNYILKTVLHGCLDDADKKRHTRQQFLLLEMHALSHIETHVSAVLSKVLIHREVSPRGLRWALTFFPGVKLQEAYLRSIVLSWPGTLGVSKYVDTVKVLKRHGLRDAMIDAVNCFEASDPTRRIHARLRRAIVASKRR